MSTYIIFGIVFLILLALEFVYFKIADKFNIIDKPNERSSHSTIVLRGGGVIFTIGGLIWAIAFVFGCSDELHRRELLEDYMPFLMGLVLISLVSFVDDIRSLPDRVRLIAQFLSMVLMFYSLDILHLDLWWLALSSLVICVGAMNIINFMDGINGITAGYSISVLVPLLLLNNTSGYENYIDHNFLIVSLLSVFVFSIFNFRPRGKAKCFAGDVGSISIAFILLFALGKIVVFSTTTEMCAGKYDPTWFVFLIVYGVDGCCTIIHRMMLHENLGEAHRKHAFQLMSNELKIGHVKVSLLYMGLQLAISLGMIYILPNSLLYHWIYMIGSFIVLSVAYVLFMKKYYHFHEEYLVSLKGR